MERLTYRMGGKSFSKYSNQQVIEHLAYIEDKQEQGLLIELPCKLWTTVYEATVKCKLNGSCAVCHKEGCWKCNYAEKYVAPCVFNFGKLGDFGKTVFLTRSEAEEALAKMGGNDHE